jgi:hypothetical protein
MTMARTEVPNGNGHAVADAPAIQRAGVDSGTLDMLMQGKDGMLRKRQEYVKAMQELDVLIQRQEGGIILMQALLQGQQEAAEVAEVEA